MPKKGQVKDLKVSCLLNIAQNIDTVWCADYINNYLDQVNFLYVIGPFEFLPPSLVSELLKLLSEKKQLKRHHLHLLINHTLSHLDLSILKPVSNSNLIVKLVNNRCQNLVQLNISGCRQISARFMDLLASLPLLKHFDASDTLFDNNACAVIGHYCLKLQELNISGCCVDDNGIYHICPEPSDKQKGCRLLKKLDISETNIGLNGVQNILLRLKELQWLVHPFVYLAIGSLELFHEFKPQQDKPNTRYKICNMTMENFDASEVARLEHLKESKDLDDCIEGYAHIAIRNCPFITHLSSRINTTKDEQIWKDISSLEHLRHVEIEDENDGSFFDKIHPFLIVRGENVQHLNLINIQDISISVIGATCPNLAKFIISFNIGSEFLFTDIQQEGRNQIKHNQFSKLRELSLLVCNESADLVFPFLQLLPYCKNLTTLELSHIKSFTDDILTQTLQENPLKYLQKLTVMFCNNVSGKTLSQLLYMENDLGTMDMRGCAKVTKRDVNKMERVIKREKFLTKIIWE